MRDNLVLSGWTRGPSRVRDARVIDARSRIAWNVDGKQRGGGGAQVQASPPVTQSSWTSPADAGWRAAQVVASPAAGDTTQAGLPKRVPRANLVPGSVGGSGGPSSNEAEPEAPARSADAARSRMASFQRGVREGRAVAPQTEEP